MNDAGAARQAAPVTGAASGIGYALARMLASALPGDEAATTIDAGWSKAGDG